MDLQDGIDDSHETHEDHKARGEEVHDEFQGIFKLEGTNKRLETEDKKKNREKGNEDILDPPQS
jgi:hypothetical protein